MGRQLTWTAILPLLLPMSLFGLPSGDKLAAEAERILQNVKTTEYAHKTEVDEQAGSYKLDCSGLVCLALKKVNPDALKAVPKSRPHQAPAAISPVRCMACPSIQHRNTRIGTGANPGAAPL